VPINAVYQFTSRSAVLRMLFRLAKFLLGTQLPETCAILLEPQTIGTLHPRTPWDYNLPKKTQ
jgi:hypothetical protein